MMNTNETILSVKDAINRHLHPLQIQNCLQALSRKLIESSEKIIKENQKDLEKMDPKDHKYDRLLLNQERIENIANEVEKVACLDSILGQTIDQKTMPNGLDISRIRVPIGVISVIYESRPNVTVDVFSLCFKTGNGCVLKGGKEAYYSNTILVKIIKEVLEQNGISKHYIELFHFNHEETKVLLQNQNIDVCIPRGSKKLIQFVRENAKIPVIETGAGVVHVYVDKDADMKMAQDIVFNAKTRRVSVCNALDCLVIHHEKLNDLVALCASLKKHNVTLYADYFSYERLKDHYPFLEKASDYSCEFLDYKMNIKCVHSLKEATQHINEYTSLHSDVIISNTIERQEEFMKQIHSANLFINASPTFADGAQFGLGAEIGISTQKLHARGPMGLEALTTYQWVIKGNGQIRS